MAKMETTFKETKISFKETLSLLTHGRAAYPPSDVALVTDTLVGVSGK